MNFAINGHMQRKVLTVAVYFFISAFWVKKTFQIEKKSLWESKFKEYHF